MSKFDTWVYFLGGSMPKVFMVICSYGSNHRNILVENLLSYDNFQKYELQIVVLSTEDLQLPKLSHVDLQDRRYDPSVEQYLMWKFQDVVKELVSLDFDIFVHTEDDILFTEDNFDYFLEQSNLFRGTDKLPGFFRCEVWDGETHLIDVDEPPIVRGRKITHENMVYWTAEVEDRMQPNPHQGCIVLDRERLKHLIDDESLFVPPSNDYMFGPKGWIGTFMLLESATNWIWRFHYNKVVPIAEPQLRRSFIKHCDPLIGIPFGSTVQHLQQHNINFKE